jgi:hypothetical protein
MRAATGTTVHGESVDAERRCDRLDVGDAVDDGTARAAVREAVAGPVIGDHPSAGLGVLRLVGVPVEATAGRAMEAENRKTVQIAPLGEAERAPVGGCGELAGPRHGQTLSAGAAGRVSTAEDGWPLTLPCMDSC